MNSDLFDPVNFLAINVLSTIGIDTPSEQVINTMEFVLSNVVVKQNIFFDDRLTESERACLLLAAKGKTTAETAMLLRMTSINIESCRKNIRRKLNANSMAQAVFEGMRFGYIPNDL